MSGVRRLFDFLPILVNNRAQGYDNVVHSQTLEIETRLEILHNRLPHDMPFKKRWQLLDRINRLRDEIHLGQGVSLWSMQDDFMFAATKNVEKYLQDLENEIEQFELSWLSYRVSESKEEELDTSDDMYFEDNEDSFWDDDGFL